MSEASGSELVTLNVIAGLTPSLVCLLSPAVLPWSSSIVRGNIMCCEWMKEQSGRGSYAHPLQKHLQLPLFLSAPGLSC